MKTNHKQTALTLGNLIETIYGVCGNRTARRIIRLAIDAHVVVFREQQHVFDLLNRSGTRRGPPLRLRLLRRDTGGEPLAPFV